MTERSGQPIEPTCPIHLPSLRNFRQHEKSETHQLFERFGEFLRSAHAKLFSTQRFTQSSQNRGRRSAATRHSAPGRNPVPRLTGSVRGELRAGPLCSRVESFY